MTLRKHVVIVGGGFGGLAAARGLANAPVRVTIVDRKNHHLFQPLLYQVAMAGLSPAEIAAPIRSILASQENVSVRLDEAIRVDWSERKLELLDGHPLAFDYLVVACGSKTNYFGHGEWEANAPGLKTLDDAIEIRKRVLVAFEEAERDADDAVRQKLLTFVVVGGGPTGVELAGSLAELADFVLAKDFRRIKPDLARVILLEGGPRLLPAFDEKLSARAQRDLVTMGVDVRCNAVVQSIGNGVVTVKRHGTETERIEAITVVWGAGVRAEPLATSLSVDAPEDRAGRATVNQDCSLPRDRNVFVVGDAARFVPPGSEVPLPGVSPTAMQQGRFVADQIARDLSGEPRTAFSYVDKGIMATIGRGRAVLQSRRMKLSGFVAWFAWLLVHIYYLIDFRNRIAVFMQWAWSYVTYRRGARLITGDRRRAGTPSPEPFAVDIPEQNRGKPTGDGAVLREI